MNSRPTNVDSNKDFEAKIRVCIAIMEAQLKELKPTQSADLIIRKYLMENPTAKISAEQNTEIDRKKLEMAQEEGRGRG